MTNMEIVDAMTARINSRKKDDIATGVCWFYDQQIFRYANFVGENTNNGGAL
jgi:hypothetical protein